MATTSQKRAWYPEYECAPDKMTRVEFPGLGQMTWALPVANVTVPAWQWFADIMWEHDYRFRESAGGTYKCRDIAGTSVKSLHAYGLAIDLNPSVNSYGQPDHDYPPGFISNILDTGMFRWGGDWTTPDPMHWEIDVPPSEIKGAPSMILSDEAQEHFQTVYEELKRLDPPTSGAWARTLIEQKRKGNLTNAQIDAIKNQMTATFVEKGKPVVVKGIDLGDG